jgi:hypothetical protein
MLGRFIAILPFRPRTGSLIRRPKVIDDDTFTVSDQLVRLHGIDAPEPDVLMAGQPIAVRRDVVGAPRGPYSQRRSAARWSSVTGMIARFSRPMGVDIGRRLGSAGGVPAALDRLRRHRQRGREGAGSWRGKFVNPWELAQTVAVAARAGTFHR